MVPSEVVVVGGATGHGKTQWVVQVAHNVAATNKGVAFLSLEMSIEELNARRQCFVRGWRGSARG